ncbi:hypothetical protein GIB67_034125 [Kingdonia uniflora]|uniref:Uncharacterized protein n=1 Tax=Kingdonia uniflora TaxID=39325 RepID=A0A7J7MEK3_9MAGN|nr:hypothetical protein GIB67_034125 [Kingdonia uniflora]
MGMNMEDMGDSLSPWLEDGCSGTIRIQGSNRLVRSWTETFVDSIPVTFANVSNILNFAIWGRVLFLFDDIKRDNLHVIEALEVPQSSKGDSTFKILHMGGESSDELVGTDRALYMEATIFSDPFGVFQLCIKSGRLFDTPEIRPLVEAVMKDIQGGFSDVLILIHTFRNFHGDFSPTEITKHLEKLNTLRKKFSTDLKVYCEMLPTKAMKDCF